MAVHGVGGVHVRFTSRIGWGYGRILGGTGKSYLVILDLRTMMTLKLDSDMMCGVGIKPSRQFLRSC
jgi:hypothetical protein